MLKIVYSLVFTITILFVLNSCDSNNKDVDNEPIGFHLKGTVESITDTVIYLTDYVDREYIIVDSCSIIDNNFEFTGFVEFPQVQFLKLNQMDVNIPVFVENKEISISGNATLIDSIKIIGSESHKKLEVFKSEKDDYDVRLKLIADKYYLAKDKNLTDSMEINLLKYDQIDSVKNEFIKVQATKNKGVFGLYLISRYLLPHLTFLELDGLIAEFSDSLTPSKYYQIIQKRITILENTMEGAKAPLFQQRSLEQQLVSLSDYKGKYVLIDFWASWCGSCRRENPNVVEAYKKYNKYDFEILGISLDKDEDKWKQAIIDDKLIWTQVSDLKGWDNEVAQLYGVNSIPHSILIDPNGVIIAKDLREEALHEKLRELFEKRK